MSLFEAYRDKTVFLTGYTGFVGDVLFQSMKRLPVKKVFILTRKPVKIDDPRAVNLLGDITLPNFGLSAENLQAIQETDFFIHLAAYTRWDTGLRHQVIHNSESMLHACELARQNMPQLQCLFLPSSFWAGSNWPDHGVIPERIIPVTGADDPEYEFDLIINGPEGTTAIWEHYVNKHWPTLYSYSKSLGERLAFSRYPNMPILIGRIASVCYAHEFPSPGYGDSKNSYPAYSRSVLSGNAKFLIMYDPSVVLDNIPVDICANMIIANVGLYRYDPEKSIQIINCTSSRTNPTPFSLLIGGLLEAYQDFGGEADKIKICKSLDEAMGFLYPYLEKKEKWAVINATVLKVYDYAFRNDFIYDDKKCRAVIEEMDPNERDMFNLDMKTVDWNFTLRNMYKRIFEEFAPTTSHHQAS